ncbi:MAG TPA: phospholipase D-like domain-containing protein [Vicinamibacterales bacterium]|jgi:phosphatidylserine/phosphatidylglycerophosphate/cardiolipin synthase-like enzyme|nr:phospholipase D-like domain-containing protein [Vicinamibacterales bacterium]
MSESRIELLVQPRDGITPIINAIKKAKSSVELTIFRFDMKELQKALEQAVARGVKVHALIAHQAAGEGKKLRKLELELLNSGVTVSRSSDDLVRYHDKLLIIDREVLYALAFNWAKLDIDKSRSLGIVTRHPRLLQEAIKLFEADATRQPYAAGCEEFLVSPENARAGLAKFIKGAKKELLIYEMKISDKQMIGLLKERAKAGVEIRIIGKMTKKAEELKIDRMPGMRLHLRAILRDGQELFIGSQSMRALELDKRRELGVVISDRASAKCFRELFEEDWADTGLGKDERKAAEKEKAAGKEDDTPSKLTADR